MADHNSIFFLLSITTERAPINHFIAANDTLNLNSPAFPESYPNDINIIWILTTEVGHIFSITFINFSTEKKYDQLLAGNGDFPLNQFFQESGSITPPEVLSNGNVMWLQFMSDTSFSAQGFSLRALSVLPSLDTF